MEACRETLQGLDGSQPPTADNLEAARRVLINRHLAELTSNKYWCEQLTGTTMDALPNKKLVGIQDYTKLAEAVTVKDLQVILKLVHTSDDQIHTCIGTSGSADAQGASNADAANVGPDEHGRGDMSFIPGAARRR